MSKELPFETQTLSNGKANPKYVDLLDEDKAVAGQRFVCISFVSPDKILKKKELFLFEEFLKHWDYSKGVQKFSQFLNFISYKYNMNFDKLMTDYQDFVKNEEAELVKTTITDDYKNFLDAKEEELENVFNEMNSFQTNTRGIKVRGSYPSQEEAELRCKLLRELDPNHDVFVGPVGTWMPWEPEAYRTGRVEYLNDELNQLMHEKNKNEKQAKREFEKRVSDAKKKAIEDNKKLAKETGNKLTQNIDDDGNLIGVGSSTVENNLKTTNEISSADIRKELFEGENIRTRQTDKAQKESEAAANIDMVMSEKKDD
jgi:hypothetical protein